jgi:hypothetical protein
VLGEPGTAAAVRRLSVEPLSEAAVAELAADQRSAAAEAAGATAVFHDVGRAQAAGYGELRDAAGIACISPSRASGRWASTT